MDVRYDLHTHTTYSDGYEWSEMALAAEEAGLEAIGFADHCPVVSDEFGRREMYDFTETYPERRAEFEAATGNGIRVLDAAEINYDPRREEALETFVDAASFDYTIGSVHYAGEYYITHPDLADAPEKRRQDAVDTYVEWQVALIESELFDIVSHLDVVQRSPQLRGLMERSHYVRLADALATSSTVPELNAGRLDRSYGAIHPHPDWLDVFAERDITFVVGTDAHAPDQLPARLELLEAQIEEVPVDLIDVPPVLTQRENGSEG